MQSRNKRLIFLIYFLFAFCLLFANIRALWVTPWDITDRDKVLAVVRHAEEWGITDLLVEVRYRGDALYRPNRINRNFPNPEPRSYLLDNNPDFDALQTFIDNTRGKNIRIHAWVTVNVVTTRRIETIQSNHLYRIRPHWLTYSVNGNRIEFYQFEGAYIDPGVPEVKEYLVNVFSDIVSNYDIDGLHLDYIRYPSVEYGYNSVSIERYDSLKNSLNINSFQRWKEIQLNELVKVIGEGIKRVNPNIIYSAAVLSDVDVAIIRYSQNWLDWLDDDLVDYLYIMAYQSRNSDFENIISKIPNRYRNKIVVGLRAWSDDGSYRVSNIRDKIQIVPRNYSGISFFSYGGIIARQLQAAVAVHPTQIADTRPTTQTRSQNTQPATQTTRPAPQQTTQTTRPAPQQTTQTTRPAPQQTTQTANPVPIPANETSSPPPPPTNQTTTTPPRLATNIPIPIIPLRTAQAASQRQTASISQEQTNHLLETKVFHDSIIRLEIINSQNIIGTWSVLDMSEKIIAEGILTNADRVVIIPDSVLLNRYVILKYETFNENFIKLIDLRN